MDIKPRTRGEIQYCYVCGELLNYCACHRCQECEELTPDDVASKRCECGGKFY
jgi:hypothetical protein